MWSAITSYLGEAPPPPSTPRKSPPTTPRKLSTVMSSEKRAHESSSITNTKKEELTILRGIIVGSHRSGKTSLLRRLRGEDITNSHGDRKLMALLPWKMSHSIDGADEEVVQLYLSEAASFSYEPKVSRSDIFCTEWKEILQQAGGTKKHSRKPIDFAVWMIDSRRDAREVLSFIKMGLEYLYPPRMEGTSNENASQSTSVQCLCILLNFRDLQHPDDESLLQQVREVANTILSQHTSHNNDSTTSKSPSILVYESSMLTNYGIQSLQSFIALPYLLYKEKEYERRLREVTQSYITVKRGLLTNSCEKFYEDHVQQTSKQSVPLTPKRHSTPKKEIQKIRSDSLELSRSIDKQIEESIPTTIRDRRQLFPPQPPQPPSWTPLHQNLDSFFSDEESEEEIATQDVHVTGGRCGNVVLDSDDDSTSSGDEEEEDTVGDIHSDEEQSSAVLKKCVVEPEEKKEDELPTVADEVDDASSCSEVVVERQIGEMEDGITLEKQEGVEEVIDESESHCPKQTIDTASQDTNHVNDDTSPEGNVNNPNDEVNKSEESDCNDVDPVRVSEVSPTVNVEAVEVDSTTDLEVSINLEYSSEEDADNQQDVIPSKSSDFISSPPAKLNGAQSHLVLDSDDESMDIPTNKADHDYQQAAEAQSTQSSSQTSANNNEPSTKVKAAPSVISSAALAAIEAARLEAERALGEAGGKSKEKKSKKEKKKSKSKKSKKEMRA